MQAAFDDWNRTRLAREQMIHTSQENDLRDGRRFAAEWLESATPIESLLEIRDAVGDIAPGVPIDHDLAEEIVAQHAPAQLVSEMRSRTHVGHFAHGVVHCCLAVMARTSMDGFAGQ